MTGQPAAGITSTDGRVLGRKALTTRLRILEAFERQLGNRRFRDINMTRVGSEVGLSAASVWQYFPDVEAILFATAALYDGADASYPPHLRRVLEFVRREDQMLSVTRPAEPDTRLELLAALIPELGDVTAADARRAFKRLGFRVPIDQCEALLRTLVARGRLWPVSPLSPSVFVHTKPIPTAV